MDRLNGRTPDFASLTSLALTGYGHFTSMRVEDGRVRGLALHLERLARDCAELFAAELDLDLVRAYARQAVAGHSGALVCRVTVFDPQLELARPAAAGHPSVLVTTRPAGAMPPPPLRVLPVEYTRELPGVKHVALLGPLRARREAQLAGFDDALFHDASQLVSEGGTWNVGFVRGEEVVWPKAPALPGVTCALLQRSGHRHTEEPVTLQQARGAEAAFATNTAFGVRPLAAIGDTELRSGNPLLLQLQKEYAADPGEAL